MGIDTLPTGSSFGHAFNYEVWTADTQLTLCNVPWNSDYRDIVNFATRDALDTYLAQNAGDTIQFGAVTYARAGVPVRVNIPFNVAYHFNYLRVYNPPQPVPGNDGGRAFYYFVTDVRYVAPNTTELEIQLDVWQSFCHDVTFGNCYIERGHIGVANTNQMLDYGREYLTVPEGLDIGGEYQIIETGHEILARTSDDALSVDIIVASTVSFDGSGGTIDAPVLNTAQGSGFELLPNGCELYWFPSTSAFTDFMRQMTDVPWVTQGIISVTAVPSLNLTASQYEIVTGPHSLAVRRLLPGKLPPQMRTLLYSFRTFLNEDRYHNLNKFYTYPYTAIELTTYSGTPVIIKPEGVQADDFSVVQLMHLAPPGPRIIFYPYHYNKGSLHFYNPDELDDLGNIFNDNGEFLDVITGIFDLPTFSVVNNGYLQFMAANRNGIAFQHQSADWSQQKALAGNALAYNQAGENMGTSSLLTDQSVQAARQSAALANSVAVQRAVLGGVQQIGGGAAGGVTGMAGGAMAAAGGAASAAIDISQRNQQTAISTGLSQQQNRTNLSNAAYMRDTNRDYADFAARGDYQNTIGAINAKVQDAKLTQPSTAGQVGGDAFNLAAYQWAVHAKLKTVQGAARHAIGEYWLRYGYAVNRFSTLPASLQVMSKFTYWKLRETYLRSSTCPEVFRQTLRGIFEKGVTVWSNPSDIGMIDIADNDPLPGVTL